MKSPCNSAQMERAAAFFLLVLRPGALFQESVVEVFADRQRVPYLDVAVQQHRRFERGGVQRQFFHGVASEQVDPHFAERQIEGVEQQPGGQGVGRNRTVARNQVQFFLHVWTPETDVESKPLNRNLCRCMNSVARLSGPVAGTGAGRMSVLR